MPPYFYRKCRAGHRAQSAAWRKCSWRHAGMRDRGEASADETCSPRLARPGASPSRPVIGGMSRAAIMSRRIVESLVGELKAARRQRIAEMASSSWRHGQHARPSPSDGEKARRRGRPISCPTGAGKYALRRRRYGDIQPSGEKWHGGERAPARCGGNPRKICGR